MTQRKRSGEKLCIAILWHQHQPVYRSGLADGPRGSYLLPWVRLHAVRDYYSMAAMLEEFPNVHATINLVPSLLWQLEDYLERGATDVWMERSLTPTEKLSDSEKSFITARFFDADWNNEIRIYSRYAELLEKRRGGSEFSDADITDLKMWFNLAWFPPEARTGTVLLPDGSEVSVARHIEKGRGFDQADIEDAIEQQYRLMRNVVPMHRRLVESGQLEITFTPFYHPILPLVADTDLATIDAHGSTLPPRFSHPEDAAAQIEKGATFHAERFGVRPRGMWPSEGSVGEHIVPIVADAGVEWMATDRGVLEKSGVFGYETEDPEILLRPYLAGPEGHRVSVFFRHTRLSDDIGFSMQGYADYDRAAEEYLKWIREGFARRVRRPGDRVLSIILDGENAWSAYRNCGRAFLRGIYRRLNDDPELVSVKFSEFIDGNPERGIRPHPPESQEELSPLYTASWIDEMGSPHGNDLNIWVGSPEENRAWELLGLVRAHLDEVGATPESHPEAFESIYIAEGSDWFWWFGDDFVLPAGADLMFDRLFREHLKSVYAALGETPPDFLESPVTREQIFWTREDPVRTIEPGKRLRVMCESPGSVRWSTNLSDALSERPLEPAGDVMAQLTGYAATLGPFDGAVRFVDFRFRGLDDVWENESYTVLVRPADPDQ